MNHTLFPPISRRELEVLKLSAWGLTDKETAYRLNISIKSVSTYRHRAMEKLGLSSRAGIVLHAVNSGWLMALPQEYGEPRRAGLAALAPKPASE